MVPEWSFPGRGPGAAPADPGDARPWTWPSGWSAPCPSGAARRRGWPRLEEQHLLADRALGYVELYGAYTETEARFRVDRLLALWDRMDADDRQAFCFDPAVIDWAPTSATIHLPSVVEHARVRTTPGRSTQASRADRARKAILSPDRHLAAFDLENTLIASNVVESYAWLATRHLPAGRAGRLRGRPGARGAVAARPRPPRPGRLPALLLPPLRGRARSTGCATTAGSSSTTCCWPSRSRPASPGSGEHRALGHRTILITGALDFVVEPLRPLFDEIVCARLGEADGRSPAGSTSSRPPARPGPWCWPTTPRPRASSLEESMAYADSASDLPMLEAVGLPGGRQPRGQAGRHRPPAGLARRALGQGRRGRPAAAAPRPARPPRSPARPDRARPRWPERSGGCPGSRADEGARLRAQPAPLRRVAGGLAARLGPRARASGPCSCSTPIAPELPGRRTGIRLRPLLSGICGSDLATVDGRSSRYFEDLVSFPFVPGHEVVGVLDDGGDRPRRPAARARHPGGRRTGARLRPARHRARSAPPARTGHTGLCGNVAFGDLAPGLQTGFCADTGGGWSTAGLVAHASQLHAVPDEFSRRGRGHGRADRLRRPRRAVGRRAPTATWWRSSAPARSGWPRVAALAPPGPAGDVAAR